MSVQDCSWAASGPGRCQKYVNEGHQATHILPNPISLVLAVHIYTPHSRMGRDTGDDRAENGKRGKPNHVEGGLVVDLCPFGDRLYTMREIE